MKKFTAHSDSTLNKKGIKHTVPPLVASRARSAGAAGEAWLSGLDSLISELEEIWDISVGETLYGGTHAFVAYADGRNGEQYVLKADMPEELGGDFDQGMAVLKMADGHGYVRLYKYDPERKACLMERLGKPVNQLGCSVFEQLQIICSVLQKAWEVPVTADARLSDGKDSVAWFRDFVGGGWERLGRPCPHKVIEQAFSYLQSRERAMDPAGFVLIHGDAHGANTLRELSGEGFKLVDPDGILYEKAYDLGVLMREWVEEYEQEPLKKGKERCRYLCRLTGVSERGIWEWGYLQTVSTAFVLLQIGQEEAGHRMLRVAECWAAANDDEEPEYIEELCGFLASEYGLTVKSLIPAKRGFYGETWSVQTESGRLFLKIDYWEHHQDEYKNSLSAVQYMTDSGISFIPKLLRTKGGELCSRFRKGIAAVFEHVPGELSEDYPTEQLYSRLARIYRLKTDGLVLRTEGFGTELPETYQRLRDLPGLPDEVKEALAKKGPDISWYMERLKKFAGICRGDTEDFHITHGDAGGNCILNDGRLSIVDWDSCMLAPIERDAWIFICDREELGRINALLADNGIGYSLKEERLCYYCYSYFFHYLNEYLKSIAGAESEGKKAEISKGLVGYLTDNWIYERLQAADSC